MLLITHTDLDGVVCAILYKMAFGHESVVEYVNYDKISDTLIRLCASYLEEGKEGVELPEKPDTLHITDISPQGDLAPQAIELLDRVSREKRLRVQLFDHHASSRPMNTYDWVHHRLDVCGAKNYFDWLRDEKFLGDGGKALNDLVNLTDIRDRWVASDPMFERSKDLNALLTFFGKEAFVSRCLEVLPTDVVWAHIDIIKAMREKEDDAITKLLEVGPVIEMQDFEGRNFALLVASGNVSEICQRVLQQRASIDYVAAILPDVNAVSLRSRDDGPDVAKLANVFGGGGHPHAAGFQMLLRETLLGLIGEMFTCGTSKSITPLLATIASLS
jgi:oligoribonuclease NrnB/cAMP/cGMP phosphodiesterase (DHH superfamily)